MDIGAETSSVGAAFPLYHQKDVCGAYFISRSDDRSCWILLLLLLQSSILFIAPTSALPIRSVYAMHNTEAQEKVHQYQIFLRDVLKPRLEALIKLGGGLREDLKAYEELEAKACVLIQQARARAAGRRRRWGWVPAVHGHLIARPQGATSRELTTSVDVGCGVKCQAVVRDTSRIYISIGLGFRVECSLDEVGTNDQGIKLSAVVPSSSGPRPQVPKPSP